MSFINKFKKVLSSIKYSKIYFALAIIFLIFALLGIGYIKSRYESSVDSALRDAIEVMYDR